MKVEVKDMSLFDIFRKNIDEIAAEMETDIQTVSQEDSSPDSPESDD